jgi:site-specific DNA recombinase
MNQLIRAALYARVSSERQADELTIQSQVEALKHRLAKDGCEVEPELCFLDEGFSGNTMQRPALERLRDLAYSGVIDRVYVLAPDRLARKYAYQVVLMEELRKHGVEVVFLNDVAAATSPEADLLLQMQGMIAEYERTKILERTRRGRRFAARQGKVSVLGHAPYGYRYVRKHQGDGEARYEVLPAESRHVQAMFSWVGVEGLSLGEVSRRLREQGIPSPTGQARWDRATVRGILRNPAYQGLAMYGKTRLLPRKEECPARRNASKRRGGMVAVATMTADQEQIPVPSLISAEMFAAVAERLSENRQRHRLQKIGTEHLLGGLLVCGRCGSSLCGRRYRKNLTEYVYYRCIGADRYRRQGGRICTNASLPRSIEQVVWSDLCSLMQNPERMRTEMEQRLDRPVQNHAEIQRLEQAIAVQKRRIARLLDAYENEWLDKAEFEPRVRTAKERLARDEKALQDHRQATTNDEELRLVISQFDTFAAEIKANLENADFDTKRRLLRLLVKRIEVTDESIHIVYKVSLRPFVNSPSKRGNLQHCLKSQSAFQAEPLTLSQAHPQFGRVGNAKLAKWKRR